MKTVYIFTVGSSTDPIIKTIRDFSPDFIYFVCSSGAGSASTDRFVDGQPLKEEEKIIAKELNLEPSKYKKILLDNNIIDDLEKVFKEIEEKFFSDVKERFANENIKIVANYTGGTKTMSSALVLLSIVYGWDLQLNTGIRTNVIKIEAGDTPVAINKINLFLKFEAKFWQKLMEKFYYEEIVEKIKEYLLSSALFPETKNALLRLKVLLEAFIYWDKFDHEQAFILLENVSPKTEKIAEYYITLKKILGKMSSTGYEKIYDLLRNAERRAIQQRYDDAIARLYRALEMLAQQRLKLKYGIESSSISLEVINNISKEKAREFLINEFNKNKDEKGRLKMGLIKCYEVLYALEDELGMFYKENKRKILNAIEKRNNSILAHGNKPILENDFKKIYPLFKEFIETALKDILNLKINIPQFPRSFKEIEINF